MEEFERHYYLDIPITTINRKHIYPKFGISRDTLLLFSIPILKPKKQK